MSTENQVETKQVTVTAFPVRVIRALQRELSTITGKPAEQISESDALRYGALQHAQKSAGPQVQT